MVSSVLGRPCTSRHGFESHVLPADHDQVAKLSGVQLPLPTTTVAHDGARSMTCTLLFTSFMDFCVGTGGFRSGTPLSLPKALPLERPPRSIPPQPVM